MWQVPVQRACATCAVPTQLWLHSSCTTSTCTAVAGEQYQYACWAGICLCVPTAGSPRGQGAPGAARAGQHAPRVTRGGAEEESVEDRQGGRCWCMLVPAHTHVDWVHTRGAQTRRPHVRPSVVHGVANRGVPTRWCVCLHPGKCCALKLASNCWRSCMQRAATRAVGALQKVIRHDVLTLWHGHAVASMFL